MACRSFTRYVPEWVRQVRTQEVKNRKIWTISFRISLMRGLVLRNSSLVCWRSLWHLASTYSRAFLDTCIQNWSGTLLLMWNLKAKQNKNGHRSEVNLIPRSGTAVFLSRLPPERVCANRVEMSDVSALTDLQLSKWMRYKRKDEDRTKSAQNG